MPAHPVYFDDSLKVLCRVVASQLGADALRSGLILRDTTGRLVFFARGRVADHDLKALDEALKEALGPYAREDGSATDSRDPGVSLLFEDPTVMCFPVGDHPVCLLDRRVAGVDWLRKPAPLAKGPPRYVFASLKGGAGRSTALAVIASHFSAEGKRVLAVDLDLEAPGLGAFLLPDDQTPVFGVIDALVENGLGKLDETFLADVVGASPVASSRGRVDVMPAFGRRSLENPGEVLGKLARAYAEDVLPDGSVATILDQVSSLLDRVALPERYDLVLVDARAGLHETTAASMLGLGAEVFLFGRDERQTFHGYAALLAHLGRLGPREGPAREWVDRLNPVHALAPVDAQARDGFTARWQTLVRSHGPLARRAAPVAVAPASGVSQVPWDESVSDEEIVSAVYERERSLLHPLAVLRDSNFEQFDPLARRDQLSSDIYRVTFGQLLDAVGGSLSQEDGVSA